MQKAQLVQQFITLATKFRKIVHQSYLPTNMEEKLATILQMQALHYLKENTNLTVGEFAKKLNMSSPAIAQFCDRLVKSGWVRRKYDTNDRRIIHLSLTNKGRKQFREIKERHFKRVSQILSLLNEKDLKEMIRIMTKLVSKVEEKHS